MSLCQWVAQQEAEGVYTYLEVVVGVVSVFSSLFSDSGSACFSGGVATGGIEVSSGVTVFSLLSVGVDRTGGGFSDSLVEVMSSEEEGDEGT